MKSDFFLTLFVALLGVHLSLGNNGQWYKDSAIVDVVPYFLTGYFALQSKIIGPILLVTINDLNNETIGNEVRDDLAQFLTCGVKVMRDNITNAYNNSQAIDKKLEDEIAGLVLSISQTERDITTSQNSVASLSSQIGQVEGQVRSVERAVNEKQNNVNQANQQVAEAQSAGDKAQECREGVSGACGVLNSGGIDQAKDRQSLAERELNDVRSQLASYQQQLNNVRDARDNLQNQLSDSRSRLQSLNGQVNSLREQQTLFSALVEDLRRLVFQISNITATSTVLQRTVEQLTDFETLINPLNAVYNRMSNYGLIIGNDATVISSLITAEKASEVRARLNQLQSKLAAIPFNPNVPAAC